MSIINVHPDSQFFAHLSSPLKEAPKAALRLTPSQIQDRIGKPSENLPENEEKKLPHENLSNKRNVAFLEPRLPLGSVEDSSSPAIEAAHHPKNKYVRTMDKLGEGSFGLVLKVRHCLTDSPAAMKVHTPDLEAYSSALKESLILSAHKQHRTPHSLFMRDSYESTPKKGEDNKLCPIHTIVMDLVPAPDIYENHLKSNAPLGPLAWDEIRTITRQVLEFTAYSGSRSMTHLDLKPSNMIYLKSLRQLTVLDYGLSEMEGVTERGWLCQTAPYRCPEEILSFENEQAPPRTSNMDVWSVGCILFELLTHHELFPSLDNDDNLPIGFKHHLQMIARQIGMPPVEYLSKWDSAKNYYSVSPFPPYLVRIKKPKKLAEATPWREEVLKAAQAKGIAEAEINLFIHLIEKMVSYTRPSAQVLLKHPYFKDDVSFHLKGNFSAKDVIQIYKACDVQHGKPIDAPALLIDTPSKMRHDCFHVPRDPKNQYFIIVQRGQQILISEYREFEDGMDVTLQLPVQKIEPSSIPAPICTSTARRTLFEDRK